MTDLQNGEATGKKPMQSKKFVAYLFAESTWKAIIFVTIIMGFKSGKIDAGVTTLLLAIVIIAGFIEAGYILGQASLDKYVRIAEITGKLPGKLATAALPAKPTPKEQVIEAEPPPVKPEDEIPGNPG